MERKMAGGKEKRDRGREEELEEILGMGVRISVYEGKEGELDDRVREGKGGEKRGG